MNRWSTQITQGVNDCIAKGRQPMGKGSRRTTYQNMFRSNREIIEEHSKGLKATFRNANARSRVCVTNQGKWYLADNKKAIAHNHTHFQFFAKSLRDRGLPDAMPMLIEFITFLMGNLEFTKVIGQNATAAAKPTPTPTTTPQDDSTEDEFSWETATTTTASAAMDDWGDMGDEPSFSDEEDELM
tara:strand:+ start:59 stop:613 length:555 start_codon:yes stop_codon:yes gene_type:complete